MSLPALNLQLKTSTEVVFNSRDRDFFKTVTNLSKSGSVQRGVL